MHAPYATKPLTGKTPEENAGMHGLHREVMTILSSALFSSYSTHRYNNRHEPLLPLCLPLTVTASARGQDGSRCCRQHVPSWWPSRLSSPAQRPVVMWPQPLVRQLQCAAECLRG